VEDRIRLDLLHQRTQPVEVDDVQLAQLRHGVHTPGIAGGQVIDDGDLAAVAEQRVDDV
jgi:hypothetical protein